MNLLTAALPKFLGSLAAGLVSTGTAWTWQKTRSRSLSPTHTRHSPRGGTVAIFRRSEGNDEGTTPLLARPAPAEPAVFDGIEIPRRSLHSETIAELALQDRCIFRNSTKIPAQHFAHLVIGNGFVRDSPRRVPGARGGGCALGHRLLPPGTHLSGRATSDVTTGSPSPAGSLAAPTTLPVRLSDTATCRSRGSRSRPHMARLRLESTAGASCTCSSPNSSWS